MSIFKTFLAFAIGAAAGSATTYFLLKKKYESDVENEVREVREYYRKSENEPIPETEVPVSTTYEKSSLDSERHARAQRNIEKPPPEDYTRYYEPQDVVVHEPEESPVQTIEYRDPYPISPNEFAEDPSYSEIHLCLHPNGVMTDEETGEEVDDLIGLIGTECEHYIGEYEVNTVRVRNERLSTDIEIVQELPKVMAQEKPTVIVAGKSTTKTTRKPHEE